MKAHIKTLEFRYKVKLDEKTKAEIERLTLDNARNTGTVGFFPWKTLPRLSWFAHDFTRSLVLSQADDGRMA